MTAATHRGSGAETSRRPEPRARFRLAALSVAILVLVCGAVYGPTAGHDFVGWDDYETIAQNAQLRAPADLWASAKMGLYVPVTYAVWASVARMELALSPARADEPIPARGYHLLNVLIHTIAVLGVWALLRRVADDEAAALLGSLLFAAHPVQVETVAWASGGKDLLAGCLGIWALVSYASGARADGPRAARLRRGAATVLYLGALASKPNAVALPAVLVVFDVGFLGGAPRRALLWAGGWLIAGLPIVVVTRLAQEATGAVPDVAVFARPILAADALAFYARKLVAPVGLAVDYGRNPQYVLSSFGVWFSWLIPVLLGGIAWRVRRSRPFWLAGGGLFVAALAPVLGLIPFSFQSISTVADHYLYLPMLGLAAAAACELARRGPVVRSVFAAVLALLALLSIAQVSLWRDSATLFAHTLEVNPRSPQAHVVLAEAAELHGRFALAASRYRRAIRLGLDPGRTTSVRANWGLVLLRLGRAAEARDVLLEATRAVEFERSPTALRARIESLLAAACHASGDVREARRHLGRARRLDPAAPGPRAVLRRLKRRDS